MKTSYRLGIIVSILIAVAGFSCTKFKREATLSTTESSILLEWLTTNGNWINSQEVPAVISADEAYEAMKANALFIDLRDASQYAAGHIPFAVNVQPADLLDFLDNRVDINSFDKVIFVCNRGQLSAWVNAIVRMLGYSNTFSLRFGLSGWDTTQAANGWDKVVSDKGIGMLIKAPAQTPDKKYDLPHNLTALRSGYEILHQRAARLLAEASKEHFIEFDTLVRQLNNYYIINYWSTNDYEFVGHLPGAWQFSPRKALSKQELLLAIPTDQKVVVYCYTGHHSAHATAFLRMLGYDAYSLLYGANGFMHSMLKQEGWPPSHQWGALNKRYYPINNSGIQPTSSNTVVKAAAKGGC